MKRYRIHKVYAIIIELFWEDVVLDRFNMANRDEDIILDQAYQNEYICGLLLGRFKMLRVIAWRKSYPKIFNNKELINLNVIATPMLVYIFV